MQSLLLLIVLVSVGQASAQQQQFASVQDVVAELPELSVLLQLLNTQLKGTFIPKWLQDPSFNGTVFASVNAGLKPLHDALKGNWTSVLGDPQHVADLFSTAVVPGKRLNLEFLQDGMQFMTLNNHKINVAVVRTSSGTIVRANRAYITTANIPAGNAIVHLVRPMVAAPEHQDLVDVLQGFSLSAGTPTTLWQDYAAAQSSVSESGPSAGQVAAPQGPQSAPSQGMVPGAPQESSVPGAAADAAPGTAWPELHLDSYDGDPTVNYNFEQDFMHAEQAALQSSTGQGAISLASLTAVEQEVPPPDARSSAGKPGGHTQALLLAIIVPLLLLTVVL